MLLSSKLVFDTKNTGKDSIQISLDYIPAPLFEVTKLPGNCTIWQNHLVAWVDTLTETEATATLLSLYEWGNMPSANHTTYPDMAQQTANDYLEGDLSNWSIPTSDQAKRLKVLYATDMPQYRNLNELLRSLVGDVMVEKNGNDNARYLCDEDKKTFSLVPGTSISAGGTKAQYYHLRTMKVIRLAIKD